MLRDSGSSCVVVRKGLVERNGKLDGEQKTVHVYLANGKAVPAPVTEGYLESPYFSGKVSALEMANPMCDVILGYIPGVRCPGISVMEPKPANHECKSQEDVMAVETRARKMRRTKPLTTSPAIDTDISVTELKDLQEKDETLTECRKLAATGEDRRSGKENRTRYTFDENGVVVRTFQTGRTDHTRGGSKQVLVPQGLRNRVMKAAHDSIVGSHLAAKKTTDKILSEFFWPNIWDEVKRFCQSCDQSQRSAPKGQTSKVPLSSVPLIDEPFSRVAVDLIGPIIPSSERGYKYILVLVDYCTRYPEAVPLKTITTEAVAEAMVDIFSRVGIPKEILSDKGLQFTSDLMAEICRLLSVKQLTTSPYHPQCNGLVERFNATLKSILKKRIGIATSVPPSSHIERRLKNRLAFHRFISYMAGRCAVS